MNRKSLKDALFYYESSFSEEMLYKPRFLSLINNFDRCFTRQLMTGHLTGSAWIVDGSGMFTLLTLHKKLNRWLQPGGHADGDENLLGVSVKEAFEETGLESLQLYQEKIFDIDIHQIPANQNVPAHFHFDIRFLYVADINEPLHISDESHDLAWIALNQLAEYVGENESIHRMAHKTRGLFQ